MEMKSVFKATKNAITENVWRDEIRVSNSKMARPRDWSIRLHLNKDFQNEQTEFEDFTSKVFTSYFTMSINHLTLSEKEKK
jgi:hypothetical protein